VESDGNNGDGNRKEKKGVKWAAPTLVYSRDKRRLLTLLEKKKNSENVQEQAKSFAACLPA
jgi:hypothetical protein